jgi:hypothetical protein
MRCKKDILAENKFKVEKLVKDVFELKNDSDSIRFNELSKIASTFSKDENYDFFIFFQREKLKANLKNSINVDYSTKMLKILPELETIYTDLNEESKTRFGEILYHLEEYQLFELLSTSKLTEKINS